MKFSKLTRLNEADSKKDMSYPSPNILPTVKSLEKLITFATEHEIEIKNIFLAH